MVLFELAARGELNERGMPSLLRFAVLAPAFAGEARVASPPWAVQPMVFALLSPISRLRGYASARSLSDTPTSYAERTISGSDAS